MKARADARFGLSDSAFEWGDRLSIEHDWLPRHLPADPAQAQALSAKLALSGMQGYHATNGRTIESLVGACVQRLLDRGNTSAQSIDLVLYTHTLTCSVPQPPHDLITALAQRFGTPTRGFSIDQYQCSSAMMALQVMERLMQASPDVQRVLFLTADITFDDATRYDVTSQVFHSDGAAAAVFTRGEARLQHLASATVLDTVYFDNLARDFSPFAMASYELTAVRSAAQCIQTALERAGLAAEDLAAVIPSSTDPRRWQRVLQRAGIPVDRMCPTNRTASAHLYGCDVIFNLMTCVQQGQVKSGDRVACLAIGEGRTFGCSIFQV